MFNRIKPQDFGGHAKSDNHDASLKMKNLLVVGFSIAIMSALVGCSDGGVDAPASTGAITTSCSDVSGVPDIMGSISFNPATAASGASVILSVPVDAEAEYVFVQLTNSTLAPGAGFIGGGTNPVYAIPSPGVQTLSVPVDITSTVKTDYRVTVTLCTVDPDQCLSPGSTTVSGVATVYQDVGFGALTRVTSSSTQAISCVNNPVFTVL